MEFHKRKGDLGVDAMAALAFAVIVGAAILLAWTTNLPVDKQVINMP